MESAMAPRSLPRSASDRTVKCRGREHPHPAHESPAPSLPHAQLHRSFPRLRALRPQGHCLPASGRRGAEFYRKPATTPEGRTGALDRDVRIK